MAHSETVVLDLFNCRQFLYKEYGSRERISLNAKPSNEPAPTACTPKPHVIFRTVKEADNSVRRCFLDFSKGKCELTFIWQHFNSKTMDITLFNNSKPICNIQSNSITLFTPPLQPQYSGSVTDDQQECKIQECDDTIQPLLERIAYLEKTLETLVKQKAYKPLVLLDKPYVRKLKQINPQILSRDTIN